MAISDTPKLGLQRADTDEIYPLAKMNANMDKIDAHLAKMGSHLVYDEAPNTVLTSFATIASGWENQPVGNQSNKAFRQGLWCFIEVSMKRKGAAINNPSTGDIANDLVLTVKSGWRPAEMTPLWTMNQGRIVMSYLQPDGGLYLAAFAGTGDFNTGHAFNVGGWYILED